VEPLCSLAVATRGNRWQTARPLKRPRQAKTVAVGCDRLPESFHGKEAVLGSSPAEGLNTCKAAYFGKRSGAARGQASAWMGSPRMLALKTSVR